MVYRVFVEKKEGLDNEAKGLLNEAKTLLGMERLENVRLFNRYDAENITEDLFRYAVKTVFSEPQLDTASASIQLPGAYVFAVEALPGQFDQRADSAAQCIQIISQGERPLIRTAKVYALYGALTDGDIREFKKYVINPVECREASLDVPETLAIRYDIPTEVATLTGFTGLSRDELAELLRRIAADGTRSVLFSTHITSDLEKCASHITFIKDGTIQHTGTLADFRQHYDYLRQPGQELTLEDIIVSVERRPLDENAII